MDLGNISFDQMMAALKLSNDPIIMAIEVILYIVFFLNLIGFFMQDDKQLTATMLMGGALLANVVAKLSTSTPPLVRPTSMIMLFVNSMILILPMFVSGMSKAKKSKPATILSTVLSAVFFFMYWYFLQSGQA